MVIAGIEAGVAEDRERARIRGSGAQRVYESLRRSILEMTLEPGSPLDEVSLSEQFDMSRTPIREALVRLTADGLVVSLPNRNTIVAPIDFARLPIYFEALTLMSRVTTRLAGANRQEHHLIPIRAHHAAFAEAVERRDALAMLGCNREFHVAIAEAGGNVYFTHMFARLLDEGRRILRLYYTSFDDRLPRVYVDEHEQIMSAVEKGDPDLCDRLAGQHVTQFVRQVQDYIARTSIAGMMLS